MPASSMIHENRESKLTFSSEYDVIVVGARVAGAATAAFLARAGAKVLLVDPRRAGSDTLSTHALMRMGVQQLHELGILDRVRDGGAAPITSTTFHYESQEQSIPIRPSEAVDALYAPRRYILDQLLADRAEEFGADVRLGCRALELLWEGSRVSGVHLRCPGGEAKRVTANWVIGADGADSSVARWCGAQTLIEGKHRAATLYAYLPFSDAGYRWVFQSSRGGGRPWAGGVIPTNGDASCVFMGGRREDFMREDRPDPVGAFSKLNSYLPDFLQRPLQEALKELPVVNHFFGRYGKIRQSSGPGWALVGDALCNKDPATAHGISNALRDAQILAHAIINESDFGVYESALRDLSLPLFEVTERVIEFSWTLEDLQAAHVDLAAALRREGKFMEHFRKDHLRATP